MQLYEIVEELRLIDEALEKEVDAETGEVTDEQKASELLAYQERITGMLSDKTADIIRYVKNLESDILVIETERKRLQEREKRAKNKLEQIKKFVQYGLENMQVDKYVSEIGTIRLHKAKSVNILDESKIPEDFKEIIEEVKIHKAEIGKWLKVNGDTDWAEMKTSHSVVIK